MSIQEQISLTGVSRNLEFDNPIEFVLDTHDVYPQNEGLLASVLDYDDNDHREVSTFEPFTVTAEAGPGVASLTLTPTNRVSVEVTAPVAGQVTVNSYATVGHAGADGSDVLCKILESTEADGIYAASDGYIQWFDKLALATLGTLNGTRTFTLAAGETNTYGLRCIERNDGGSIYSRILTAIFTPTP